MLYVRSWNAILRTAKTIAGNHSGHLHVARRLSAEDDLTKDHERKEVVRRTEQQEHLGRRT